MIFRQLFQFGLQVKLTCLRPSPVRRLSCVSKGQLTGEKDRYSGITVDLKGLPSALRSAEFNKLLQDSLKSWRQKDRGAIWLKIPITHSHLITVAAQHGFTFHHAEHQESFLKLWLPTTREDSTPVFATHQVGVCGVVLREDTQEVLAVQDKNRRLTLWKFPGGLSDLGENIADAAVREVKEETGVTTEFRSILAFRQQHDQPGAFGRSDIFVVCRMRPLTFDIDPCDREIARCQWMPIHELRQHIQISSITHRVTSLLLHGITNGFDKVDITSERMKSIYKGLYYELYHRTLPSTAN